MKLLKRMFSFKEKILLVIFSILVLSMIYIQFVDRPIRRQMSDLANRKETQETEMTLVLARNARKQDMLNELSNASKDSVMPSYNAVKEEIRILDETFSGTRQYNVTFSDVTRNNNQIRRNFAVSFVVNDYSQAMEIVQKLNSSECRCLIGDLKCRTLGTEHSIKSGQISVSLTGTFYETMVGGIEDAGLPANMEKS